MSLFDAEDTEVIHVLWRDLSLGLSTHEFGLATTVLDRRPAATGNSLVVGHSVARGSGDGAGCAKKHDGC